MVVLVRDLGQTVRIALGGSKSGKPWERFTAPYWLEIRVMRRMTESVKPAVRSESGCIGRSPLLFIPICLLGYFALYRGSWVRQCRSAEILHFGKSLV